VIIHSFATGLQGRAYIEFGDEQSVQPLEQKNEWWQLVADFQTPAESPRAIGWSDGHLAK
jgi:hypothetical protein